MYIAKNAMHKKKVQESFIWCFEVSKSNVKFRVWLAGTSSPDHYNDSGEELKILYFLIF